MGWWGVYQALLTGRGPYGGVSKTLVGEGDPARALQVALSRVDLAIERGEFRPSDRDRRRLAYWRWRASRA